MKDNVIYYSILIIEDGGFIEFVVICILYVEYIYVMKYFIKI